MISDSKRFFANRSCEYYPCHNSDTDINCLFCYCPLYHLPCPGNYQIKEKNGKQIKSCIDCVFPHIPENYDIVIRILQEEIYGARSRVEK